MQAAMDAHLYSESKDVVPQSPVADSEQLDSLQRLPLRKRSTLHDFSIMKARRGGEGTDIF